MKSDLLILNYREKAKQLLGNRNNNENLNLWSFIEELASVDINPNNLNNGNDIPYNDKIYKKLIEISSDFVISIIFKNNTTKIEFVTGNIEKVTEYSITELKKIEWIDLIHQSDLDRAVEFLEHLQNNETDCLETRIVTKSAKIRWLRIYGISCSTTKNKSKALISAKDITEAKQFEFELIKQANEIEKLNQEYYQLNEKLKDSFSHIQYIAFQLREKQAFNESVLKASPFGIGVLRKTKFDLINDTMSQISGYTKDELNNSGIQLLYFEEAERDRVDEIHKNELNNKGICTVETIWKHKSGKAVNVLIKTCPIVATDLSKGVIFTVMDMTEWKNTHKALIDSEENFRNIFSNTYDSIAITSISGEFLDVNQIAHEKLGYTKEEFLKLKPTEIVSEKFKNIRPDVITKLQNNGHLIFESEHITKTGETIPIEVSSKWIQYKGEKAILSVTRDITERKRIEQVLIEAKEKAEESDRLKSSFLANMSHEIRTPMNGILGFAQLLDNDNLDLRKRKNYIEIIRTSADQLMTLINDIIDISKLEAGQLQLAEESINLNPILQDIFLIYTEQLKNFKKSNIEISVEYGLENGKDQIQTDSLRLTQILSNLMSNAIKFTSNGKISFGYKIADTKQIIFYVKDTGIGISKHAQKHIFERFRQEDDSITKRYGGTGLGLSICNALINLFGGKIWLESEKDVGSTFYFEIPYKPKSTSMLVYEDHFENIEYNWQNKKILIVEDVESNFWLINEILQPTQAKIIHTKFGKEAIEICKNQLPIDLILMDIQLPDINGYETTKIIKQANNKIPIIAQTAYAMDGDLQRCIDAGCDDYLAKPTKASHLLYKINKLLF